MMVSMAGLQVFVVRFFFQGARKGMCHQHLAERILGLGGRGHDVSFLTSVSH